jgi:prepilin-type N-terminal cleavage/methylation domain-containing protein/prepilin-type processing-associated H-X9-DG protein
VKRNSIGGRGFTLVELLVVIGIIAVLISILLPALSKSRYQAQLTTCMARLQQFSVAMNIYAVEHKGFFPRFDTPLTGQNLLDVSNDFYDVLNDQYKLPHQMFFCPLTPEDLVDSGYNQYGYFKLIGYQLWVPRLNGTVMLPPQPGDPGFTFLDPLPFRGPVRLGELGANERPILTDLVISEVGGNPTVNSNAATDVTLRFHAWSRHRYRGLVVDSFNAGYADGHVERLDGSQIKARYVGNYWNWR